MELVSDKLSVKLDGVVHELSYPTVKQVRELDKKKDDLGISEICDLIESCGMAKDVVENLQASHLNKIVEALMGKKS